MSPLAILHLAQRPGKYGKKVNELLGTGAFGEVYKMDCPADAEFSTLYPIVAVKKIRVSFFIDAHLFQLTSQEHTYFYPESKKRLQG